MSTYEVAAQQGRVFWPGDDIPVGVTVMGSDGQVVRNNYPAKVDPGQPVPLIEIVIPDYHEAVAEAAEKAGVVLGENPRSGRWGVLSGNVKPARAVKARRPGAKRTTTEEKQ